MTTACATGAKQNGLRDHSWEKRPSPRGRFRVLTAPRRSSCQRRDSRDIIEADIDTLPEHRRRFAIVSMSRQQFSEATGAASRRAAPNAQNKKLLPYRSAPEIIQRSLNRIVARARLMSAGNHSQIWIEQCEAARTIRERFGLQAAFDYAVGEKLMNFASAASEHPAFAMELPRFVSEVRRMFSADEIRGHLARLEREQIERDTENRETDEDEFQYESPARAAERVQQMASPAGSTSTNSSKLTSARRSSARAAANRAQSPAPRQPFGVASRGFSRDFCHQAVRGWRVKSRPDASSGRSRR